jgi:excisionase family DNA binding protein
LEIIKFFAASVYFLGVQRYLWLITKYLNGEETMENQKLLLDPRAAAKVLSVSPRTLWSLTHSGEIKSVRIGRLVRYPIDALREFVEARAIKNES